MVFLTSGGWTLWPFKQWCRTFLFAFSRPKSRLTWPRTFCLHFDGMSDGFYCMLDVFACRTFFLLISSDTVWHVGRFLLILSDNVQQGRQKVETSTLISSKRTVLLWGTVKPRSITPTYTFSFYKNNAYKNMRLRFGPNFWSIFLNTIDIQHRITQKESTHSIFILSLYLIGRVGWKVEKVEKKVCNTDENPYSIIKWSKLTHS